MNRMHSILGKGIGIESKYRKIVLFLVTELVRTKIGHAVMKFTESQNHRIT